MTIIPNLNLLPLVVHVMYMWQGSSIYPVDCALPRPINSTHLKCHCAERYGKVLGTAAIVQVADNSTSEVTSVYVLWIYFNHLSLLFVCIPSLSDGINAELTIFPNSIQFLVIAS